MGLTAEDLKQHCSYLPRIRCWILRACLAADEMSKTARGFREKRLHLSEQEHHGPERVRGRERRPAGGSGEEGAPGGAQAAVLHGAPPPQGMRPAVDQRPVLGVPLHATPHPIRFITIDVTCVLGTDTGPWKGVRRPTFSRIQPCAPRHTSNRSIAPDVTCVSYQAKRQAPGRASGVQLPAEVSPGLHHRFCAKTMQGPCCGRGWGQRADSSAGTRRPDTRRRLRPADISPGRRGAAAARPRAVAGGRAGAPGRAGTPTGCAPPRAAGTTACAPSSHLTAARRPTTTACCRLSTIVLLIGTLTACRMRDPTWSQGAAEWLPAGQGVARAVGGWLTCRLVHSASSEKI